MTSKNNYIKEKWEKPKLLETDIYNTFGKTNTAASESTFPSGTGGAPAAS